MCFKSIEMYLKDCLECGRPNAAYAGRCKFCSSERFGTPYASNTGKSSSVGEGEFKPSPPRSIKPSS